MAERRLPLIAAKAQALQHLADAHLVVVAACAFEGVLKDAVFGKQRVGAVIRRSPDKPVLVWGDKAVAYGEVVALMAALQEAGAAGVGLVTEDPR